MFNRCSNIDTLISRYTSFFFFDKGKPVHGAHNDALRCWKSFFFGRIRIDDSQNKTRKETDNKYQMVRQAHHPEPSRRANHNDRNSKYQTCFGH